jgi:hypothetical protein
VNSQIVFDSIPAPNIATQSITIVAARQAEVVTPNFYTAGEAAATVPGGPSQPRTLAEIECVIVLHG